MTGVRPRNAEGRFCPGSGQICRFDCRLCFVWVGVGRKFCVLLLPNFKCV